MYFSLSLSLGSTKGGSSFSPLALSPALWLDASDASTLYDSTSGGSLTAPNGTVARWEDKSGNGRHATQSTAVSQPLRKTSVQNGRDVVRFDGANDGMGFGDYTSTNGLSVFAVGIPSSIVGGSEPYQGLPFVVAYRAASINDFALGVRDSMVSCYAEAGGGRESKTGSLTINQPIICFGEANSTRVVAGLNGVLGTPSAGARNDLLIASIGRDFVYGGNFYSGDISEILVFPTTLSNSDRSAVESYLNSKWAVY
jgi:hypothetical protein